MASVEASPARVLTSIGNTVIKTTTAAFDGQPKPNHMTMIGAMPMIGIALMSWPTGVRPRCRKGDRSIPKASRKPALQPMA
jgi:hypothetical protein